MAQSIRDIKRRIKGIGNMMQITNAMGLVASAKLIKAREKLIRTRPYYFTVRRNIQQTINTVGENAHPLLRRRPIRRSLYIIISDDRGLAGGYNNNVVRMVEKEVEGREEAIDLVLVGMKAIEYFRRKSFNIKEKFTGITEDVSYSDAQKIGELALDLYKNHEIDEIKIAYTRFINNMKQVPEIIQLMPPHDFKDVGERKNKVIDFEPSPEEVLDYLIPKYVISGIYGALMEAACSEQAARRIAMEVATENGKEITEDLKIKYNRARQTAITTELTEIITGTEVLK